MTATEKGTIAVVGAGFMGTVIATLYAHHGYRVALIDTIAGPLESFRERARPIAQSLTNDPKNVESLFAKIRTTSDLASGTNEAFLVQEAIHENLAAKQQLFAELDQITGTDVVLATNTSSFRLSEVFQGVRHRNRVLGIHYVTPAHLVKVVELIAAEFTPPALIQWAQNFMKTIDHVGVVCADSPGFLVNRLQYAMLSECYRIVEEGIASREDVDTAYRLSLGPRLALWGPLLTEDLVVSKKTVAAVWDYLFRETRDDKFRRPPMVTRFVEEGKLGAVSGEGLYKFEQDPATIVELRDARLKSLLQWLEQNNNPGDLKVS